MRENVCYTLCTSKRKRFIMKKWNATQLKYLMASVMLLDHIPNITGIVSPIWEGIFHAMTRYVGVWFAFMSMEGFIHIRNLKNYSKMNPKIVHIA